MYWRFQSPPLGQPSPSSCRYSAPSNPFFTPPPPPPPPNTHKEHPLFDVRTSHMRSFYLFWYCKVPAYILLLQTSHLLHTFYNFFIITHHHQTSPFLPRHSSHHHHKYQNLHNIQISIVLQTQNTKITPRL